MIIIDCAIIMKKSIFVERRMEDKTDVI